MATISDIRALIKRAVRTGTNLHFVGNPGIGKTEGIVQAVDDMKVKDPSFKLWIMYTPSMSPLDFQAMMPDMETQSLLSFHNDAMPNAYDDPDIRGLLWLGERDNADPATNKALQKYINGEDMGGLRKPEGVIVVSDSNDTHHRSGVIQQSLALISRSRRIEVYCDSNETLSHFGSIEAHEMVRAYLALRPDMVDTFDAALKANNQMPWANPRAWKRVSDALIDADSHGETLTTEEIIGDIGSSVGTEFAAFMATAKSLVSYEDVISNPEGVDIPSKSSDVYAVTAFLASKVKAGDLAKVRKFIERLGVEVEVLFLRLLTPKVIESSSDKRRQECARHKAYHDWIKNPELRKAILGKE